MKSQDGIKTPLMVAFRAASTGRRDHRANRSIVPAGNSTYGEPATALALAYAQLSALRKEGR